MSQGGLWIGSDEQDQRRQNNVIQQLLEGRSNATGTVTFSSTGATSTTVTAPTVGASSIIGLTAQTSAAATENWWILSTEVTPGQFIVRHSSSTSTVALRTFGWTALG